MARKMTIEDLGSMVKHGFDAVDARLDHVDARLNHIDTQLDHVDARLGRIEADIHELRDEVVYRHEFEDVLGRIKYLERKLGIESGVETIL